MAADIGNISHGAIEKPNSYFKQIDNSKQNKSQKINTDFQKILKSEQSKQPSKLEQAKKTDNGTDFALKKVAEDYEKQILGIMWNMVFSASEKEYEGGLGEELFHKELVNEMVKLSDTGEMGDIAKRIYEDLKKKEGTSATSPSPR